MRWLLVVALVGCNSILGVHDFTATDAAADAPADAQLPGAPCSQLSMLADSFTSAAAIATLWTTTSTDYSVAIDGGLQFKVNGTVTWSSTAYYDVRESGFSIAIGASTGSAMARASLEVLSQTPGNSAGFYRTGSMVELRRTHSGVVTTLSSLPYDLIAHRYLRLRVSGNQLLYETSADGTTFAVLGTADADALTFVRVVMTFDSSISYSQTIADANGGTPRGAACPITRLADDFSGNLDKWARSITQGGTLAIDSGVARFTLQPGTGISSLGLVSSTVYDLRAGALVFEIPQMVDVTTDQALVAVVQARATRAVLELAQQKGKLTAAAQVDASGTIAVIATVDYHPVAQRWWRLAATATQVSWDVSPDATIWTPIAVADHVAGLDNVEVVIAAQGPAAVMTSATVDNVGGP